MTDAKTRKRVLILCTGNSCRSQMAEGLWRSIVGDKWDVHSAGLKPAGYVHPMAITVMHEAGVDISAQASKHVDRFMGQPFDLVITVCDNTHESCPTLPGAKSVEHWPFDDPAAAIGPEPDVLEAFRKVRDQIRGRILCFLKLPVADATAGGRG